MFDPIREFELGDTWDYTFGICAELLGKFTAEPGFDGKLPHYVAVCVTKFDELPVFETARELGMLTTDPNDPYEFPRVHEDDARLLLASLCDAYATGDGTMVLNTLERHFRPERIKYYVTSAVGFNVNSQTGAFDPDDPQNLLPDPTGTHEARVRGPVRPINVLEPLVWLSSKVQGLDAAAAEAAAKAARAAAVQPAGAVRPAAATPPVGGQGAAPPAGPATSPAPPAGAGTLVRRALRGRP
jgi:hypothetical protein